MLFRSLKFLLLLFSASHALAQEQAFTTFYSPRFTLHIEESQDEAKRVSLSPNELATRALKTLNDTHAELTRIFKHDTEGNVVLKFLSPSEFVKHTGAPEWTSAMYLKDEISIPITPASVRPKEMNRALRHEYVHAFVAQLSNYKCPAWLDEGVAQIIEGPANPVLAPALREWALENPIFPLDELRNGFTTMDEYAVPAAYAQSFFATRKLIQTKGFSAIVKYLKELSTGKSEEQAFRIAFKQDQAQFEKSLAMSVSMWVEAGNEEL